MYIIKNALKCISRSKGRNILIGVIALVIAVAACIGLSIRQAAVSARNTTLEGMSVTATISFDRQSAMGQMGGNRENGGMGGGFDKDQFADLMGNASSLTLDEYKLYARAESVQDFYYTLTAYFNGSDTFEPVSTDTDEDTDSENTDTDIADLPDMMGGGKGGMMGNMIGNMLSSGDFTVIGYSSDTAMTDFASGVASITEGSVFDESTEEYSCIISNELAVFNGISLGDTVTLTNVNSDTETYTLTVVGIYTSSESNDFTMSMFGASQDPANKIYMSAAALQHILDESESVSETVTDEDTGAEYETVITGTVSATYVFADTESYYSFETEVRELGLSDSYTVSSADITAFENSLTPLNTLSTMAGWFLVVILAIGSVILVVLNIFNVRERKYEIGVLTAMGMKKSKVAAQFMCEILAVTMAAVIIGAGIGAVSAVPVTNALLANQTESQSQQQNQIENNFGRPGNMGGNMGDMGGMGEIPGGSDIGALPDMNTDSMSGGAFSNMLGGAADYITEIDSAVNLTVVLQMVGIGLLLTVVAGAASVLFVMRYDPLKILANRD